MSSTAVAKTNGEGHAIMEQVLIKGDLSQLTPAERNTYYREVCRSVGLNPLTQPLAYIKLNGKLTLYAKRDAADQLRSIHGISITGIDRSIQDGLCIVEVKASDKTGRTDADMGVVSIGGLKGEAAANAILKAVTKAKRRVTLSLAGMGFLDETEVEDIPASEKGAISPHPEGMQVEHGSHAMDWPKGWNKTKLQGEIRTLVSELEGCQTPEDLATLEDTYGEVIRLCEKHLPAWWNERSEQHPEFEPLQDRIERTRDRVEHGVVETVVEPEEASLEIDPKGDFEAWDAEMRKAIEDAPDIEYLVRLQNENLVHLAAYGDKFKVAKDALMKAFATQMGDLGQAPADG